MCSSWNQDSVFTLTSQLRKMRDLKETGIQLSTTCYTLPDRANKLDKRQPFNKLSFIKVSPHNLTWFCFVFFPPPPLWDDDAGKKLRRGGINQENLTRCKSKHVLESGAGSFSALSALTRNTRIELQGAAHTWRWVSAVSQTDPVRRGDGAFKDQPGEVPNIKAVEPFFSWFLHILGQEEEDLVICRLSSSRADTRREAADTSPVMLSGPSECCERSDCREKFLPRLTSKVHVHQVRRAVSSHEVALNVAVSDISILGFFISGREGKTQQRCKCSID